MYILQYLRREEHSFIHTIQNSPWSSKSSKSTTDWWILNPNPVAVTAEKKKPSFIHVKPEFASEFSLKLYEQDYCNWLMIY